MIENYIWLETLSINKKMTGYKILHIFSLELKPDFFNIDFYFLVHHRQAPHWL